MAIVLRNISRHCISLVLAVLLSGLLAAPSQAGKFSTGLLWKIEGKGARPSYLLGTMHSEDPRVLDFPPAIRNTMRQCDSLSLELKPDLATMTKAAAVMMYTDGRNLQKVLDRETYNRSMKALSAHGIPEMAGSLMKPWAVMMTLSLPKPKTGLYMDIKLYKMAMAEKKRVYSLETVDEQVSFFESMSMDHQVELLRESLDNLSSLPTIIETMTTTYLKRDLDGLVLLSKKYAPKNKELARQIMAGLLDKRNRVMLQRMQPRLREGNACVAVGALHLPGKTGLLQLLQQQGYRLSPVY